LLYLLTRKQNPALLIYALIFLPGVILHEGSHWITAQILRVPTRGFSLIPRRTGEGTIRFGYVETASVDPLRSSLIGLAPLLAGTVTMGLLTFNHLGVRELSAELMAGRWLSSLDQMNRLLATPDVMLWLYLVFVISNTMLPSKSDRAAWASMLILVAALAAIGFTLGILDMVGPWLLDISQRLARSLTGVFAVTVVMDGLLLLPVLLLEAILARVLGVEIVYDR
jgi:hypothetical protein